MSSDLDISNYSVLSYMRYLWKRIPTTDTVCYLTAEKQLRVPSCNTEGVSGFFEPYFQLSVEHLAVDTGIY